VKSVLERLVGKRVSVVLTSGPELSGVVTSVGDKVVLLSELTGREFFDGVVNIDQIGAVVVRTRTR
jgi:small nuclear ribonucleoprotein (snRNP)-like protein